MNKAMKKIISRKWVLAGILIFAVIFIISILSLNKLLMPKYLYNSEYASPETEMWNEFYESDKDSYDVVFIGSSHMYRSLNPVVFYENTGLEGFVAGSSMQDMPTAYYYIEEILKHQSPKYVILDMFGAHTEIFKSEFYVKRSFENMRLGKAKIAAFEHLYKDSENKNDLVRSAVFPISSYHSRWGELTEIDYNWKKYSTAIQGYIPVFDVAENVDHISNVEAETTEEADMTDLTEEADLTETADLSAAAGNVYDNEYYNKEALGEEAEEYFTKIVQLCEDNDITLITVLAPYPSWTSASSTVIQQMTQTAGVDFYDYNQSELYAQMGINKLTDWGDTDHLNAYGGEKYTKALAEKLLSQKLISRQDNSDETWDKLCEQWKELSSENPVPTVTETTEEQEY